MKHTTGAAKTKRATLGLSAVVALAACALAAALAMMPATPARAYAADYQAGSIATASSGLHQGMTFKVDGNTYRITDYEAYDDDPGEVMLVKYGSKKTTANLNSVKYKGVVFEVDTIGKNAFNNSQGHKVTSLTIGRNVDFIQTKAFYACKKLKIINMAKSDVIDIERGPHGFYIDDIEIGSNAFKGAGVAKVKVHCGNNNASYKAKFKTALIKKGMRSSVIVVK